MGVEVEWPDQRVENLTTLAQAHSLELAWKLPVPDLHFVFVAEAEASTIRNQAQN